VPTPATARDAQFLKSLKQFLDFRSISPPKALYCYDSGWLLGHLRGQFWQDGSEQVWDIPLPYCPHSVVGSNAR
jgi:hypothetical protein